MKKLIRKWLGINDFSFELLETLKKRNTIDELISKDLIDLRQSGLKTNAKIDLLTNHSKLKFVNIQVPAKHCPKPEPVLNEVLLILKKDSEIDNGCVILNPKNYAELKKYNL